MGMESFNNPVPPTENPNEEVVKTEKHEASIDTPEEIETWKDLIKEIDEMQKESSDALIETYGSIEEAERYAKMNLSDRVLHADPRSSLNMGMEENLADKITYARNQLHVLKECNDGKSVLEGDWVGAKRIFKESMPNLRDTVTSIKASAWKHLEK
jgi:hypothetical protein